MRYQMRRMGKSLGRFALARPTLAALLAVLLAGCGASVPQGKSLQQHALAPSLAFALVVATPAMAVCLPHARDSVTVTKAATQDELMLHAAGLAPNTGYALFVLQVPRAPYGIVWYQRELRTDKTGAGTLRMEGIFNAQTFALSSSTLTTNAETGASFGTVHLYHLGLWFSDPQVPFTLGCEPGKEAPVVTPFNGAQHAGIQVLNTSNFPDDAGPLKQVPG
jgi:hypothetical protein